MWQLPDSLQELWKSPGVPSVADGHQPQQLGKGERPEPGTPAAAAARRVVAAPRPRSLPDSGGPPRRCLPRRLREGSARWTLRGVRTRALPRLFVRRRQRPERPRPAEPGRTRSGPRTPAAGPAGQGSRSPRSRGAARPRPAAAEPPAEVNSRRQVSPHTDRRAVAPAGGSQPAARPPPRLTCPWARSAAAPRTLSPRRSRQRSFYLYFGPRTDTSASLARPLRPSLPLSRRGWWRRPGAWPDPAPRLLRAAAEPRRAGAQRDPHAAAEPRRLQIRPSKQWGCRAGRCAGSALGRAGGSHLYPPSLPARAGEECWSRALPPHPPPLPEPGLLCFSLYLFTNLQALPTPLIQQQEKLNLAPLGFFPTQDFNGRESTWESSSKRGSTAEQTAKGAAPAAQLQFWQLFRKAGAGHCPCTAKS